MSKETSSMEVEINQFEAGVQLVSTKNSTKIELFDSIEDAMEQKSREALLKKTSAAILFSLGITGVLYGGAHWNSEGLEGQTAGIGLYISFGLLYASTKLHDSGDFAREQWHSLKEKVGLNPEQVNNSEAVTN